MNNEKLNILTNLANQLYAEFLTDETICGFTSLFKKNNIGSKTGGHIRKILYEKYGKENVDKISFKRTSSNSHKKRSRESYKHTEDTNKKISEANRKTWSERPDLKELSRENMIKFCAPNSQSEEAKKKRVESRKWYKHSQETIDKIRKSNQGRKLTQNHKQKLSKARMGKMPWIKGLTHSDKTKKKLSNITKSQWKNGIHKPIYKSKGHKEVLEIITKLGYDVKDEYFINGRPYDVFVKDKNLVIEFNGTFWHRDPRFYNDDSCKCIWDNDLEKIDIAKKSGYDVKVIWQYDWEKCTDKIKYIKQIL